MIGLYHIICYAEALELFDSEWCLPSATSVSVKVTAQLISAHKLSPLNYCNDTSPFLQRWHSLHCTWCFMVSSITVDVSAQMVSYNTENRIRVTSYQKYINCSDNESALGERWSPEIVVARSDTEKNDWIWMKNRSERLASLTLEFSRMCAKCVCLQNTRIIWLFA